MKTKILLLLLLTFNLGVKGQIPTKHLILHQPFNGHSNDVSGQNSSIQEMNVSYSTDRVGRPNSSCHFNGNSVILNSPSNNPNYGVLITSLWFRTTSINEMCLMNYGDLYVGIKNGKITLKVGDSVSTSSDSYNDNQYHNLIVVSSNYDVPNVGFKVDGQPDFQGFVNTIGHLTNTYSFGSSLVNTFKYTGDIDDILIYSFKVDVNTVVPDLDKIYQYKPPVFNEFTYYPDSVPNFTIKGKYLQSDGGVTNAIFTGGSQNPVTVLNDSIIQTNVPFNVQNGLVMLVKGFDTTYSPIPFDNNTTGISEIVEKNLFVVYPNPSNGTFMVQNVDKRLLHIEVLNLVGERIYSTESKEDVLIEGIEKGMYFIQVNGVSKKILVE